MKFTILSVALLMCASVFGDDADVVEADAPSCSPDICELLKEFGGMAQKLESLEARLKNSESRLVDSETKVGETESRVNDVEHRLKDDHDQIEKLKEEKTKVIFSAAIETDTEVGPFDTEIILAFGNVITNVGDAYNPNTGIFVAPVKGIYYFSIFYHAGGEHESKLVLHKDDEVILMTHDQKTENDPADNGANAVFLELQKGNQVYVRMPANTHVWGSTQQTTFSGFLVAEV